MPLLAMLGRLVFSNLAKKLGTKKAKDVLKNMARTAKEQPKTGQKELFKGDAGPNVIRPSLKDIKPYNPIEPKKGQLDLFKPNMVRRSENLKIK